MADLVHLPGATKVYVDHDGSQTSNTYHLLGYTINGVEITHETFMSDVPGDQNGGDEGPPIEIQYFGQIARVRLECSKWDETIASYIASRHQNVNFNPAATTQTVGTLMSASAKTMALYLHASVAGLGQGPLVGNVHFPVAIPRSPIEFNKGSKFARLMLEFECHQSNGVLWDQTTPTSLTALA